VGGWRFDLVFSTFIGAGFDDLYLYALETVEIPVAVLDACCFVAIVDDIPSVVPIRSAGFNATLVLLRSDFDGVFKDVARFFKTSTGGELLFSELSLPRA
jgi:hypothetical protein